MDILLRIIAKYFISGYSSLNYHKVWMTIGGYSMGGHYWLLIVIILIAIGEYFINILMAIGGYG